MGQQIDFDDSTADVQAYVDERYNKLAEVRQGRSFKCRIGRTGAQTRGGAVGAAQARW